ncbi:MAG TPA: gamma-glutamyltransferase [Solirubrobacteraceae bacterium]|nr:gamma-glutamyltransferase [Solirubrobacteraceae bacterium]
MPSSNFNSGRETQLGVVAAGHPESAAAGADALRDGGNAVDAALGAMLASFACEPLLTGLGAGGYMLVVAPDQEPVLLDFFVEAPGRGLAPGRRSELIPVPVSFGDAVQEFHVGAASVGTFGMPAGVCEAARRFGRLPLERLVEPAAVLAHDGVALNEQQAYIVEILGGIVTSTPEAAALFAPGGRLLGAGDRLRQPELAEALRRLGAEGAAPFYTGDVAAAISDWLEDRGGTVTRADLAAYAAIDRRPLRADYRGREVLTNPPPSAGGILIARALGLLDDLPSPPSVAQLVEVMEHVQRERTPEFLAGLDDPGFGERFLAAPAGRLGSTTHIAALDHDGWACSVTCSNGSASGVIVPGTGVHLNNMLGEQDLNPLGFHRHPPGRRMPSMMAPTVVLREGAAELAVGSAGSNRIRSAILQTIIRSIDDGLPAQDAVQAPRVHFEDDVVYAEPGIETGALQRAGRLVSPFRALNLFFGGAQAAARGPGGSFSGGGDPRRGGAAIVVEAA